MEGGLRERRAQSNPVGAAAAAASVACARAEKLRYDAVETPLLAPDNSTTTNRPIAITNSQDGGRQSPSVLTTIVGTPIDDNATSSTTCGHLLAPPSSVNRLPASPKASAVSALHSTRAPHQSSPPSYPPARVWCVRYVRCVLAYLLSCLPFCSGSLGILSFCLSLLYSPRVHL